MQFWPLSQGEIEGTGAGFVQAVFEEPVVVTGDDALGQCPAANGS